MNTGTRIRTALAVALALYTAWGKTDVAEFNNATVNLIYAIGMKLIAFVVIFLITYYNNDYTPIAAKHTAEMRFEKAQQKDDYIGEIFDMIETIPPEDEDGDDDE